MEDKKESKVENGKRDSSPLISLEEVYVLVESLDFFVINKSKTKLKNIATEEVKELETEVKLIDILTGVIQCDIDKKIIDDLRQYFKLAKQIGYNPQQTYDFKEKPNKLVYELSTFLKIQKVAKSSSDYNEF